MRLMRIGAPGNEIPVVEHGGAHHDLRPVAADIDGAFWDGGPDRVRAALAAGSLPLIDIAGRRVAAPIARPGAVICIGLNYVAHVAESGAQPPEHPVVFLKRPNTVGGPDDDVEIPEESVKTDWEVELGVVIGATAAYLDSPQEALTRVAGFVLVDDLSERTYQLEISGGQWSKGKSLRGFTPTGPVLVTPDELDHRDLRLRSLVNGQARQDSSTRDMIFGVGELIHDLSQYMEQEPGDLVITGTPEGVALSGRFPYLADGDTVEVEIQGLGRQRHRIVRRAGRGAEV
ncbi:fumarylacetoacetate hydrolase family protein [Catenulispora rubra]|uniref:fumarylacetoacetate hydrolase family protein n=1 Tax=Catenulispora rubra TaxID=280293 RepID=UPI00189220B4|nr:fumarylacetoacetate hydrolase family protein [Catenulispora rubra]